jgi:hypothetical protein
MDDLMAAFAVIDEVDPDEPLHADDLVKLIVRAGRLHGPHLLSRAWGRRAITADVLAATAGMAWSMSEFPEPQLGSARWLELFSAAGFTIGGERASRPTEPVQLYRGSVPSRRRGMSWTPHLHVAERFARSEDDDDSLVGRRRGRVYKTLAPPEAILCIGYWRDENEHILDAREIPVTLASPEAAERWSA